VAEAEEVERLSAWPASVAGRLRLPWDSEAAVDWPAADLMASLSVDAYQPPAAAEESYRQLGFRTCTPVIDGTMTAYVLSDDDVAVVVFRGTDDASDWLVNLDQFPTYTDHGAVHRGFAAAFERMAPGVAAALKAARPKHIWVTGHSLGGALAVLCAHDLVENRQPLSGLITFGQPMVGKVDFAEHLDRRLAGKYAHFVNDADIVPRVPPGYSHGGSLVWLTEDGIRRSRPKPRSQIVMIAAEEEIEGDVPSMSQDDFNVMQRRFRDAREPLPNGRLPIIKGNSRYLKHHSMTLYLDKLRNVLSGDSKDAPDETMAAQPKEMR
jgi:hypothetical protein